MGGGGCNPKCSPLSVCVLWIICLEDVRVVLLYSKITRSYALVSLITQWYDTSRC